MKLTFSIACTALLGASIVLGIAQEKTAIKADPAVATAILNDRDLKEAHTQAASLLKTGLNAGSGYGEVWIRDLNTFIELALEVADAKKIREGLLTFFKFQGPEGDIVDGFIPKERASAGYKYRASELAASVLAHKNTVETDQESSLVQAVRKYVTVTRDRSILNEEVAGVRVLDRLEKALDYLMKQRFDDKYKLIWGATTIDWGDVQPEHKWGVELDASSHRAIDIYDNAMAVIAINDFLRLLQNDSTRRERWTAIRDELKTNIRKHLWDDKAQKFKPHIYLGDSPFPKDFNEDAIYYHGGTAVAIEADILTHEEIQTALAKMRENVRLAKADSIGLTVYPPYPAGYFKNPSLHPYGYQNGGDWCWFGGRMVQQLIRNGFVADAFRELKPMIARVRKHGDFREWWSPDGSPQGSRQFRGSAGVLGKAVDMLMVWARQNSVTPETDACAQASPQDMAKAAGITLPRLPWHLINIWWEFESPTEHFESLEMDVTIDRDIPSIYNLYVSPVGVAMISGKQFYGGLQSNINGWGSKDSRVRVHRGKGGIFSRWATDKVTPVSLDNAGPEPDGLVESAGYEGSFASVRRPFAWTKGTYTYMIVKGKTETSSDKTNTWFHCRVRDENGAVTEIGSLRFEGSDFTFWAKHSAFVEVYSTEIIPRSGIPKVNITFGWPRLNGVKKPINRAHVYYPDKGPASPDCAWVKADGEKARVEVGQIFARDPSQRRHDLPIKLRE